MLAPRSQNWRAEVGHYLGLDASTQSLTAIVIDTDEGQVVAEKSLIYGEALPHYQSPKGFLPSHDPRLRHSDPLMWVEALDRLLGELAATNLDLGRIRGISGAGQQHGSVYLRLRLEEVGGWSADAPLVEQVRPLLSRLTAPIWMDSTTSEECLEIAASLGGDANLVKISGSRATLRFTGPQIRRFAKTDPSAWERTQEVHLVSSFMASLLIGTTAGIDLGDGAGMNLLDLDSGQWHRRLLEATAPGLDAKLPSPVPSSTEVGRLAPYFAIKYGLNPGTPVIAWTGDNPSSLVGMGATRPGTAVISLGTSDTVFAAMTQARTDPKGYGHVFGNPAGGYMSLICFANGSLAREAVAQRHHLTWDQFRDAIAQTRPGNEKNLLLPYFVPEITPRILKPEPRWLGSPDFVSGRDVAAAVRAIVEAQALSLHSAWIGEEPDILLVTGGAAKNAGILQVLADVFQSELLPLSVSNSSALGGALRAAHAVEGIPWGELSAQFSAPDSRLRVVPDRDAREVYRELGAEFARHLDQLLSQADAKETGA
jgi:xylulokinase